MLAHRKLRPSRWPRCAGDSPCLCPQAGRSHEYRQSSTQAHVVVCVCAVHFAIGQVQHNGVDAAGKLRDLGAANACLFPPRGHGVDFPAPRVPLAAARCAEHLLRQSRAERSSVVGGRSAAGGRWGREGGQEQHVSTPTSSQAEEVVTWCVPFDGARGVHAGRAEGERRRFAGARGDATLRGTRRNAVVPRTLPTNPLGDPLPPVGTAPVVRALLRRGRWRRRRAHSEHRNHDRHSPCPRSL